MESKEKGEEREGKKQGLMVKKLRRGILVGKRGGMPCTPPPRWRLQFSADLKDNSNNNSNNYNAFTEFLTTPTVSARKLCASLWDFESHHSSLAKRSKGGARIRSRRRLQQQNNEFKLPKHLVHLSNLSPQDDEEDVEEEPATASSLGRAASASPKKHHRSSVERNNRALQPLSPASYGSSLMEVGPYKPAATPTSSLDWKFRMGESNYSLKTSAELIKVFNRIWSLEEQHASHVSLVKALKMELYHSRARIKELLREKQSDREQMDNLMKQLTDDKLLRKSIEQDRIRAAVQSIRDELEDERKLRKRSESLHRKLARELSEMKSSFSNVLRELERERKAGILLENLCDEFAKGIRDYEQEVRSLKSKPEKDRRSIDKPERLILHISEAWLDERMQMKLAEAENDIAEKITIVDKLGFDIATFLQAKQTVETRETGNLSSKERYMRRHSLESLPLNEAVSAPRHPADEDSTDGDSHCLEASKRTSIKQSKSSDRQHSNDAMEGQQEGLSKSNCVRKKVRSQELIKGTNLSEERMTRAMSSNRNKIGLVDKDKMERENLEATGDLGQSESSKALKSDRVVDNLIRNHSLSLEANKTHFESCSREDSCMQSVLTGNASPVQQWNSKLATPDFEKSESSLRWPQELDENTLMAKLIEARLERRRRSRSKPSKGSF